jgi:hypothetical protein
MSTVDPYVITVTVTLASQATSLKGGRYTLDSAYHYSFDPDVAFITQANTPMVYVLNTTLSLNIVGFYSTDAKYQLGDPQIAADGQSVTVANANSQSYLMFAFLLVAPPSTLTSKKGKTNKTGQQIICLDPSIINRR